MKEKEAIRILGDTTLCTPLGQAAFFAIERIKELQQYREIGTVEECREAVEKRIQKRALRRKCSKCDKGCDSLCEDYTDRCPECKKVIYNEHGVTYAYCPNCGQALDWSEESC